MFHVLRSVVLMASIAKDQNKLKWLWKLFRLEILLFMFFLAIQVVLEMNGLHERYSHPVIDSLHTENSTGNVLLLVFVICLLGPFMEELAFRLMVSNKSKRVVYGGSFCLTMLFLVSTKAYELLPFVNELAFDISFLLVGGSLGFLFWRLLGERISVPNIYIVSIVSSCLFALLHLNVIGVQQHWVGYLPVLCGYFCSGFIYAYAAYRLGFLYAFVLHMSHNILVLSVGFLVR